MTITNPKVAAVFANDSQQMKFIAAALAQLLGEEDTETLISEIMPQEAKAQPKFKGMPLVLFNGLDREQLKSLHNLTDAEVDEVYALMGVTESADVKSDAAVVTEAVASAGTGTDKLAEGAVVDTTDAVQPEVVTPVEGTSEAVVDASVGQVDKSAVVAKQSQTKGQAKSK